MVTFVDTVWVAERIDSVEVLLLDPRRPMKYMQGHLKNAVNLPAYRAFDENNRLLSPEDLSAWIGAAGLDDSRTPVLYDSPQRQNASLLAWILEHLGRDDVHLMSVLFEGWVEEGREIYYKPVEVPAAQFSADVNAANRITLDEMSDSASLQPSEFKLIDFRSREEYAGERGPNGARGHIPGAVNVAWEKLYGASHEYLLSGESLEGTLVDVGVKRNDPIVAYCQTGPRASLGYLALRQHGYDVRLFDGSFAEWATLGLPAEVS